MKNMIISRLKEKKNMYNTIILKVGKEMLTESEYKKYNKGDAVYEIGEELKRWDISDKAQAQAELSKYRSSYNQSPYNDLYYVDEYALEYCECDEHGNFVEGSDFEPAEIEL